MRKPLTVGILKETKCAEFRAPLVPADVAWLVTRGINVEVETSATRTFKDKEYKRAGATIVTRFKKANLLVGVKEPRVNGLYPDKVYMVFSHTIKGCSDAVPLLEGCLAHKITLLDYEKIVDKEGKRLVYFGRFAGICGAIDSFSWLGRRLVSLGIDNPFAHIHEAGSYKSLKKAKESITKVSRRVSRKGLTRRITPFIIGITGHGNVSAGVQEIVDIFKPIEIHPKEMKRFVRSNRTLATKLCKIVFDREEKLRAKNGSNFYFEGYLKHPKRFESNMDVYLPHVNMLFNTSYWDRRYPRLLTKATMRKVWQRQCRLTFIGDISCDVNGSIELTHKTTSVDQPIYTYDPEDDVFRDGYAGRGVTILARDNLPSELPREASRDFSALIKEYVYQIAVHGVFDITNHVALPRELREAVIVQGGTLTKPYQYLKKCLV